MSKLSVKEANAQLHFAVKVLSNLIMEHTVKNHLLFLIYFGQIVSLYYSIRDGETIKAGAETVDIVSSDNTLVSAVKLRNAIVHYNINVFNNALNKLKYIEPSKYTDSSIYAYAVYIKEIDWKELKDFYNKI